VQLESHVNKTLADTLGNLLTRCTAPKVLRTFAVPAAPAGSASLDATAQALVEALRTLPARVGAHYEAMEFGRGIDAIFEALHLANRW
jgi:methionyl-tRNA synthetase